MSVGRNHEVCYGHGAQSPREHLALAAEDAPRGCASISMDLGNLDAAGYPQRVD